MSRSLPAPGELLLLSKIRSRAGKRAFPGLRLGIGDDCAILRPGRNEEILVTTDLSLEGIHFRREWHQPESIGHRCLVRGLSDIAAMGGRPLAVFLSLAVPAELTKGKRGASWLDRFYDGLLDLAKMAQVPLAGGDLAQSPSIAADIVLVGATPRNKALLRSGARPGDRIYVTGALGGSAAELLIASHRKRASAPAPNAAHPHFFPSPRLAVGKWLIRRKTSAAIDISDGLSTDLTHLCEESKVAAEIFPRALPIHPLAAQAVEKGWSISSLDLALHGGEDYELLFTAPELVRVPKEVEGVPITKIGRITKPRRNHPLIVLIGEDEQKVPLLRKGWEHFTR